MKAKSIMLLSGTPSHSIRAKPNYKQKMYTETPAEVQSRITEAIDYSPVKSPKNNQNSFDISEIEEKVDEQ